jgi:hypothetical protein
MPYSVCKANGILAGTLVVKYAAGGISGYFFPIFPYSRALKTTRHKRRSPEGSRHSTPAHGILYLFSCNTSRLHEKYVRFSNVMSYCGPNT